MNLVVSVYFALMWLLGMLELHIWLTFVICTMFLLDSVDLEFELQVNIA